MVVLDAVALKAARMQIETPMAQAHAWEQSQVGVDQEAQTPMAVAMAHPGVTVAPTPMVATASMAPAVLTPTLPEPLRVMAKVVATTTFNPAMSPIALAWA